MSDQKLKVMFVDDDFLGIQSYEDFFSLQLDFECEFFYDPIAAKERLGLAEFDVLVTDYDMPRMNGVQLSQFAKENDRVKFVIMISGSIDKKEFEIADKFISKGRGFRDLLKVLNEYK